MQFSHNPDYFPPGTDARFGVTGTAGMLEACALSPKQACGKTVVICHPHPEHGGTMHNKVVYTLSRAYQARGFHVVRFNYRGVGQSSGQFGNYQGEISDLLAVIAWVEQVQPAHKLALAGFSFGCFIACTVAMQLETVSQLTTVAPAVHHKDFSPFLSIDIPWLIVQGSDDEVVPSHLVIDYANRLNASAQLNVLDGAGHFFHGRLTELRSLVEAALV